MSETLYHFGVKGMKWGVRRGNKNLFGFRTSKNNRYESDDDFDNTVQRMMQKRQKIVDDGKKEASKLMKISLMNNLISSLRNEQATNDACDDLKKSGLFDDFYF